MQKNSLHAPSDVKIDGRDKEWGGYQAHDNNIQADHTIANDDEYLYLLVKFTDGNAINRVMAGLTLSVSPVKFKKDNKALSVIYPLIPSKQALFFPLSRKIKGVPPPVVNMDSLMAARNQLISVTYKLMGVHGAKGVEPEISIYNDDQIRAAGAFDSKGSYICEMAIALKYLDLPAGAGTKLYYHVTVSGANSIYTMQYDIPDGPAGVEFQKMNALNAMMAATTDFWGEYVLVK